MKCLIISVGYRIKEGREEKMYKIPTSTSRSTSKSTRGDEGGQIYNEQPKHRGLAYTSYDLLQQNKKEK
jgi:hypothetical protein